MSTLPLFRSSEQPAEPRLLTVSELTSLIKATLEDVFDAVGVCGEISNLTRAKSGHVYFSLKDTGATVRSVLWRGAAQKVPFEIHDGLAVKAWGKIDVYAPRGEYQLIVDRLEPQGIGALELAFRQLYARLAAEGLFDPARKRPLPALPRRIVVVASPTGAAVRDIIKVATRRWPLTEILVAPSRVQGEGAAGDVARAIDRANALAKADLIILARGGGSLEDLWAFNEEIVVRAIVGSRLPVVSAIGHEVDVTLSDLAADSRAATPSEAAEQCVPDRDEVLANLDATRATLDRIVTRALDDRRILVDRLARRAGLALRNDLRRGSSDLAMLTERLRAAGPRELARHADRLAALAAHLDAVSPLAILARGYSLTTQEPSGPLLRRATDTHPGALLRTRLASGQVVSRVERVEAGD